jgi:hypothetical protein
MNLLIKTMVIIALLALIIAAVTALALAFGAALAYLLPLSLFQATLLFIASTGITILTALTACVIHYTAEEDRFLCDDCRRSAGDKVKVWEHIHRNDPCPCGSGKKFKNCCGIIA